MKCVLLNGCVKSGLMAVPICDNCSQSLAGKSDLLSLLANMTRSVRIICTYLPFLLCCFAFKVMEEFLKLFCISKRRRFNFSEVIPIRWSFNWKRFPHGRKKVSVMVLTYKTHAAKPVSSEMRFSNLPHQFKCPQKWTSFCFLPASRVAERTAIYLTQNLTGRRRSALGGLSLVLFPISPPTIPPTWIN